MTPASSAIRLWPPPKCTVARAWRSVWACMKNCCSIRPPGVRSTTTSSTTSCRPSSTIPGPGGALHRGTASRRAVWHQGLGEPPTCSTAPALRNAILQATRVACDHAPIAPRAVPTVRRGGSVRREPGGLSRVRHESPLRGAHHRRRATVTRWACSSRPWPAARTSSSNSATASSAGWSG